MTPFSLLTQPEQERILSVLDSLVRDTKARQAYRVTGETQEDLMMITERNPISELIDKLETLPPERIAEVEDFIDFLKQRDIDRQLTRAAIKMSEPSLKKVWGNPDDAVYDAL